MSKIYQSKLNFGLGQSYDLFAQTVNDHLNVEFTPRHLIIVQNRTDGPLWLGAVNYVSPVTGYELAPGAEFQIELSHERLWAVNSDVELLSGLHVTVVVL